MLLVQTLAVLVSLTPVPAPDSALEDAPAVEEALPPDAGELTERRAVPDYDGRQPEYSSGGTVWVPRLVLFPFYAVNEYALRVPIGATVRLFDEKNVMSRLASALTFRHGTIGLFPAFAIANGQRPGFGLSAFANDLFVNWHSMSLTVTTDFAHNVMAVLTNRFQLAPGAVLNFRTSFEKRNDLVFYGVGRDTVEGDRRRFERSRPMAALELVLGSAAGASSQATGDRTGNDFASRQDATPPTDSKPGHFGLRLGVDIADTRFACSPRQIDMCGPDGMKGTADDTFRVGKEEDGEAVYFYSGYAMTRVKLLLAVDSRPADKPASTGVRFDMFARYGRGFGERSDDIQFFRYGGQLSGFLDVSGGRGRILAATLYVEMLDDISDGLMPFTELVTLGGPELMRGFLRARFQGRSAAAGSLEYRWPIWTLADASLFYDIGNTFDEHLEDFSVSYLFSSYGIAFRSNVSRDSSVQLLFAVGTERASLAPERFQFAIATNMGF